MASTRHNADFANHLFPSDPLDAAIEWITGNLSPGDVFNDDRLITYVYENVEIDAVYSERNILNFVKGTYNPEDVFDARDLEIWAEDNGYVKE